jgi:hypothetical protein
MKTDEVVEVELHAFLTSAVDGGEWLVSQHGRFTPGIKSPATHWIGWVTGPICKCWQNVLDKKKYNTIYENLTQLKFVWDTVWKEYIASVVYNV